MAELIKREFIYFWYYFDIQFRQIAGYWVLGMVLGSAIPVFGKEKIHSLFAALQKKKLGILGIIPASLIVSAVCDVFAARIRACVARPGLQKCGGVLAWEWSEAE
jgi:uncharacterized membrane protein YraQ (UPF0718 family)